MQPIDNILVQHANKNGIASTTLQHGLYVDYLECKNINMTNYKNTCSDYFLSWGEDTRRLINKYHPETKVVVCGKPIQDQRKGKRESGFFTVVFDQNIFHEFNIKLLSIAYEVAGINGLKVNLKLHPYNKIQWYGVRKEITTLNQNIMDSRFVIGHTTSILFELMRLGLPVFKLKSQIPANRIDPALVFSDCRELLIKIKKYSGKFGFREYGKYYLKFLGAGSLKKYEIFFRKLENGSLKNS
jgi:hypothetical protein